RSKGLAGFAVVVRHALRNALIPVVTILGLQVGGLMGGAVVTESIFVLPGIGRLIVEAVFTRDYPVVQGVVLITASSYVLINLLVDVSYTVLNPRIRVNGGVDGACRGQPDLSAGAGRGPGGALRCPAPRLARGPPATGRAGRRRRGASIRRHGARRALDRHHRSGADRLEPDPQGADVGAPVRHRRTGPRRLLARRLGR